MTAARPIERSAPTLSVPQLPKLCEINHLSVTADLLQCIGTDVCVMPW